MKKVVLIAFVFFAIMLSISCKKDSSSTPPPAANTVDISILAMSYSPSTVTVTKGTIVRWTNNGGTTHTVTADNTTSFASPTLAAGAVFNLTTNAIGTFPYHCLIHGISMAGTLNVAN